MHVQPIDFSIFGHEDSDWGTSVRYFLPNLVNAQQALGHDSEVHLLTSGRSRSATHSGIPTHFHRCVQLPKRLPSTARYGRQLSRGMLGAIRPGVADVIHLHGLDSLHLMVGAAVHRARQAQIPVVAQEHATRVPKPLEGLLHRKQTPNIDIVICSNQATVRSFAERGIDSERIRLLPNGYDPEVFYPKAQEERPPSILRVVVLSRLVDDKDPMTMVQGVVGAAQHGIDLHLTVVGAGPLRGQMATALDSADVPTEFVEHVAHRDVGDVFRSADVFVLTSLKEGSNQAVVEAMACGLPVIVADTPGLSDVAEGAATVVPQRSAEDVTAALVRVASDAQHRAKRRDASLAVARSLSWESIAERSIDIYRAAVEVNGRRSAA